MDTSSFLRRQESRGKCEVFLYVVQAFFIYLMGHVWLLASAGMTVFKNHVMKFLKR